MAITKTWQCVDLEVSDGVAWVSLNRPAKRNAMNPTLNAEMLEVLQAVDAEPEAAVLVLTGAGEAFSAGMDLKEYFREVDEQPDWVQRQVRRDSMGWQWRDAADLRQADHRHGQRLVLRRCLHSDGRL